MTISIRLDKDTEERLDFLAKATGRTKTFYLKSIIESGLDDMEDYYLAQDVLARIRAGKEEVNSLSDVEKALGLGN